MVFANKLCQKRSYVIAAVASQAGVGRPVVYTVLDGAQDVLIFMFSKNVR